MNWVDAISNAIRYMEKHLLEEMSMEEIASEACVSAFYFQKAFSLLCGFTVSEYIRSRRLSLAGSELLATDQKIIDIALKYGYDSPDSFTKAFTRFHGVTPTVVRRERAMIKSYAPLKIQFTLKGGFAMDYKIVEKEAFTLMGFSKKFRYDSAYREIPKFWTEHYQKGLDKVVCGMYGVSMESGSTLDFSYLIADNYLPWKEIPEGCETCVIPKHSWAVFSCHGPMPQSIQEVNTKIFTEWLPNNSMYMIAGSYHIELYAPGGNYPSGIRDENYYSEIWLPVKIQENLE